MCLVLQTNLFSTKYKYVVTLTGGIFVSLFTIYVNIYLYWDMFHQFVGIDLHPSVVVDRIVWGDSSSEKWSELHYFPRVGGVWKISDTFHLHLTLMIWSKPFSHYRRPSTYNLQHYNIWFGWGTEGWCHEKGSFISTQRLINMISSVSVLNNN